MRIVHRSFLASAFTGRQCHKTYLDAVLSDCILSTWTPNKKQVAKSGLAKTRKQKPSREIRLLKGDATVAPRLMVHGANVRAQYTIREIVDLGQITDTGSDQFGVFTPVFQDLPNYTAWQSLFDRYRIRSVRYTFSPVAVQMNTTPGTYSVPRFSTVVDFDDATAPTSFSQMQRYATYAGVVATTPFVRHFRPRAATPVYNGVTAGYSEHDPDSWIDIAYPNVTHYGLKWGMAAATPTGSAAVYDVLAEYTIEVSGQRG